MTDEAQEPKDPEWREVDLTAEVPMPGQLRSVDLTESEAPSDAGLLPWPLLLVDDE
jgi:hypothetical protein